MKEIKHNLGVLHIFNSYMKCRIHTQKVSQIMALNKLKTASSIWISCSMISYKPPRN